MATLAELTKALDSLDPSLLDEAGVVDWAQKQLVTAKSSPEHLAHVRSQMSEAQEAFAKGATGFRIKEYKPTASPIAAAKSKLGEMLAGKSGDAAASEDAGADADEGSADENTEGSDAADEDSDEDSDAGAAKPAAKGKPAPKPTRKAAPQEIGKGYYEASDDDVWGSSLGASMSKIKIGDDGKVYARD